MDIWQLHIFCKVVELKSFSKAGEAVHISQPTVSSHIKDLEEYFGVRLIDRLSKTALPTKAGELLFNYAKRLTALRRETESVMARFRGSVEGRLLIGGSTIPGVYLLPGMIGKFNRRHPKVHVSLFIGDTQKIIQRTASGDLELGVVGAIPENRHVLYERLVQDEMCLIVGARHPWKNKRQVAPSLLYAEPFITREEGSGTLKSIEARFQQKGFSVYDLNLVAEMGSTEAVLQGVRQGVGISIVSRFAAAQHLPSGTIHALDLTEIDMKRDFYIIHHKQRSMSPLCKAFLDFLKLHIEEQVKHEGDSLG